MALSSDNGAGVDDQTAPKDPPPATMCNIAILLSTGNLETLWKGSGKADDRLSSCNVARVSRQKIWFSLSQADPGAPSSRQDIPQLIHTKNRLVISVSAFDKMVCKSTVDFSHNTTGLINTTTVLKFSI